MFHYECGKCHKLVSVCSPRAYVECCGYIARLLGEEVRVKAKTKVKFIQLELFK
jgi:hypothetical protein